MIGKRPCCPRVEGILFLTWKLGGIFEFYLNWEGCFGLPYSHSISLHCGIYLFLKKGAAEIVAWMGVEFEPLVEIVDPIPAGELEFQGL
jgi:hypothetical protein